jgi:hypothetical protein
MSNRGATWTAIWCWAVVGCVAAAILGLTLVSCGSSGNGDDCGDSFPASSASVCSGIGNGIGCGSSSYTSGNPGNCTLDSCPCEPCVLLGEPESSAADCQAAAAAAECSGSTYDGPLGLCSIYGCVCEEADDDDGFIFDDDDF